MIDPSDATQVAAALAAYVASRDDLSDATLAEPPAPIGRGFDSFVYGFRLAAASLPDAWARPLVLRLQRDASEGTIEKVQREAAVQRFAADAGYPAVRSLAAEDASNVLGLPFNIMQRVMGPIMLGRATSRPWQARGLLQRMAALHAQLHRLPIGGCPLPSEYAYAETFRRRLRASVEATPGTTVAREMAWMEERIERVLPEEPAFIHMDFHPLNILLDPDAGPVVIDWTDAAIGDRHADVARTLGLFWIAAVAASSTAERVLLRAARGFLRSSYLGAYEKAYPLAASRLAHWEAFAVLNGLVQLEEFFANPTNATQTDAATQGLSPALVDDLRAYFWRRAAIADGR